jgi:TPR repeat protein
MMKRSAAAGNVLGQLDLGFCLELGRGTARDLRGEIESFNRSMEQGNSLGGATTVTVWSMELGLLRIRLRALPL